jgi:hypothetical protein
MAGAKHPTIDKKSSVNTVILLRVRMDGLIGKIFSEQLWKIILNGNLGGFDLRSGDIGDQSLALNPISPLIVIHKYLNH